MCDCAIGYVYNLNCYTGKKYNDKKAKGLGTKVVISFIKNIKRKGHHIFIDSYFKSKNCQNACKKGDFILQIL